MDRDPSRDCKHGHLRRKCPICALEEELAAERELTKRAKKEADRLRNAGRDAVQFMREAQERAEGLNESCERYNRDVDAWRDRAAAAEAACARIQEALHLVVGGPMPVTPDSLRELADFMEKQHDE